MCTASSINVEYATVVCTAISINVECAFVAPVGLDSKIVCGRSVGGCIVQLGLTFSTIIHVAPVTKCVE